MPLALLFFLFLTCSVSLSSVSLSRGSFSLFHLVVFVFHAVVFLFHVVVFLFHAVVILFHAVVFLFHVEVFLFHVVVFLFHVMVFLVHLLDATYWLNVALMDFRNQLTYRYLKRGCYGSFCVVPTLIDHSAHGSQAHSNCSEYTILTDALYHTIRPTHCHEPGIVSGSTTEQKNPPQISWIL